MKEYAKIHYFYTRAITRTIRLFVFSILALFVYQGVESAGISKIVVFLFNVFVMNEVFFRYKIGRIMPEMKLENNNGKDIYKSFTLQAMSPFVTEGNLEGVISKILEKPKIKKIMQKINLTEEELVFPEIDKQTLAKSAYDAAVTFGAKYVTTVDVFAAYFFLIERDNKLLFAKQLKLDDLINILHFIRVKYPDEEDPKKRRISMSGSGMGEALVTGWTPETKNYTNNFTSTALKERPSLKGREGEFRGMLEGLIKFDSNNVLLVGDIGSGKENLVRALAYYSFEGSIGKYLNHKKVLYLMVGALTAGAVNRSDLETRLQSIIAEVTHAQNVILYIPEFQNILGGTSYGIDLSGALLPYLKSGALPIVASMTTGQYKSYMEKNPLREAFTIIHLNEPDADMAIQMVLSDAEKIERKYGVILSYLSIASAVELSSRFLQDQVLPGSAISLLSSVANKVSSSKDAPKYGKTKKKIVLEEHVVAAVENEANVSIVLPTGDEIELLLHLEEKLHERVIGQDAAVEAISEAMRRVRSGIKTSEKPVSFLFLGPTGVGKTETAKALSDFYFGGVKNMTRLDMSEYADEAGVRRLLGAPPGAGTERGELTDKIHDHPSSLILLDEFEKANSEIHNLFLQVLDDGRLTDNKGQTVSFRNAIIIATSNAGSEFIREQVEKGLGLDKLFQQKLLDQLQTTGIFRPELLNRFDDVVTFKPLDDKQVEDVVRLILANLSHNMADQDIVVSFDDAVVEKISKEGYDKEFGARPLKRFIQDNIEDMIAQKRLTREIDRGKKVSFSVDGTGAMSLVIS